MAKDPLVERILSGDEAAFKEMVETNQSMIVNTCFGFVQDKFVAEDIAQEVFIKAFESIGSFRSDSKLSTWLYRIAVNKCLNHLRGAKRHEVLQSIQSIFLGNSSEPAASRSSNPQNQLENDELKEILKKALEKLPVNQRTVFVLSKYEGLSNKEICKVMNLSLSAVEALQNRSKRNLQKSLIYYYNK